MLIFPIAENNKEEYPMKNVQETLGKIKGEDRVDAILTGKGSFSQSGFGDMVSALANDTTHQVTTYGKDGKPNGSMNISEMLRADLKKTIAKAGYPQKSEAGVLDNVEICTTNLSKVIPAIVMEQLKCGKKFDLPPAPGVQGSIYLAPVKAKVKTVKVRDPKT
ncbi:MAG: hypothetical protein K2N48_01205, partial [Muribaculaceae bacterium]|nr:hypothetical protein [Muribaculaceae bacterium]